MRFAYIDSKGKEIELDSVEALALRIELGAISEETKLYDASQDRWAPAKEHPIFQSLSSGKPVEEAGEAGAAAPDPKAEGPPKPKSGGPPKPKPKSGGPPKPKKKPAVPPAEEEEEREKASEAAIEGEPEAAPEEEPEPADAASAFMGPEMEGATAEVHEPEVSDDVEPVSFADVMEDDEEEEALAAEAAEDEEEEAPAAEEEEAPSFEMEGELELEGETAGPTVPGTVEPEAEPAPEPAGDEEGGDVLDMDLDMAEDAEEEAESEAPEELDSAPDEEEAPSFEMEGPLEVEEEEASPTVPGTVESDAEAEPAEEPAGTGGGLELEGALDWAGLHDDEAVDEEAASEAPAERERADMFGPEAAETEEAAEPGDGEGLELEPAHAAAATTAESEDAPATEGETEKERKRPVAPRPAHWEGRGIGEEKTGGIGKILVVLVIVAALGGGGWYLFMGPGSTERQTEVEPELPPAPGLPSELVPTMNALAAPAMTALLERTDSLWGENDAPESPGQAWLRGPYFAEASQYEEIERYWVTMEEFVDDLRQRDEQLFREALEAPLREAVEAGEVSEEEGEAILDRAEWEFMAAAAMNDPYAPLDSLASAALGLHELLISREDEILTESEAGGGFGSADPILEVIVQDQELRSAMNERLDRVLRTVAETEAPTPVTTRGLMAALYEKVRATAFP